MTMMNRKNTRNEVRDQPILYRNKLNGEVVESRTSYASKYIDGVEFITINNPRGGRNFMRKEHLEKVRS